MQLLKQHLKRLWKDESAQGATEYILLLVVIVALMFIFKGKIMEVVRGKVGEVGDSIMNFQGGN